MRNQKTWIIALLAAMVIGCTRVPISGRRQVNLLPESQLVGMSYDAYGDFLNTNRVVHESDPQAQMVQRAGARIASAVETYMKKNGMGSRLSNFSWEFNLIEDPTVNAWCMPGGKIAFYRGIMPVCQDELGVAVVMGHEIAHAVARHGNERMSQQLIVQAGGITLAVLLQEKPQLAQDLFLTSYGVGSTLGSLAFSRQHETESDKLGLVFMAMAGYDPTAAPSFWERMAAGGGGAPPQFLSTHPSHDTRIRDLEAFMPEALKYYKP
jgi:predicted Zn-dependent protease